MTSLSVVALIVLLPLVTPLLQHCEPSTTTQFLTKTKLEGGILDYFTGGHFWTVALAGGDVNTAIHVATEVVFGKPNKNEIEADFDYQRPDIKVHTTKFTLEEKDPNSGQYYVDVNNSRKGCKYCETIDRVHNDCPVKSIQKTCNLSSTCGYFDTSERVYFFQCAKVFVGGYRCLVNAQSEKSYDPECFIWADWGMKKKDVTQAVLEECESAFRGVSNCHTFTRRYRSDGL